MIILQIITIVICVAILGFIVNVFESYKQPSISSCITYKLEDIPNFGIPVIKVTQSKKVFYFVVDTGANNSVINSSSLNDFTHIKLNVTGNVYGMEGNPTEVSYIRSKFKITNKSFEDEFQVINMDNCFSLSKNEYNIDITGILGSGFLKRNNLSVDVANNVLYKL
jgi:hypothetical protein